MICDGETYNNGANHVSPMLSLTYNLIPPKVVGGESGSALSVVSAKREPNNDASDSGASGPVRLAADAALKGGIYSSAEVSKAPPATRTVPSWSRVAV